MTQSMKALIDQAVSTLRKAGVASPEFDSWALLSEATGISRGELHAQLIAHDPNLPIDQQERFLTLVARRALREPLWRITGKAPFLGLELEVGPGVFTPRPETELLAHHAIETLQSMPVSASVFRVVDLCAGSGAIGIAVADATHAELLAVEVSEDASVYLRRNCAHYLEGRHEVLCADLNDALAHAWAGSVDLVVSNPPYLIPGEVLDWETESADPDLALYGGPDGLDLVRGVVEVSSGILRPGGVVIIEHGVGHGVSVQKLMDSAGFRLAHTERDLVGRDRFTRAVKA